MYYRTDNPSENLEKMGKVKKVIVVCPQDFPYLPDSGTPITGVKTMEHCQVDYELISYLNRHIEEGTLALKDVVVEMCGEGDWDKFSDGWEHPETNADGFCDFLQEHDRLYSYGSILILETDDSFMFVPMSKDGDDDDDYWTMMDEFRDIVDGMCTMMNATQPSTSSTKSSSSSKKTSSMPLAKAEVKPNASVNPMFEPAFTKL
jgi:hypothetical protein